MFLILFLGLAFYSCGAPSERKLSKEKISYLFYNMLFVCEDDPTMLQLVLDTKMAYVSIDKVLTFELPLHNILHVFIVTVKYHNLLGLTGARQLKVKVF